MENNGVLINKKIVSTSKVLEVSGDVIVPDIKPDIVSIINTNGIPYIFKEDVGNSKFRFDGNIDTFVVYLADNGETRSLAVNLSFIDTIENLRNNRIKFGKNKSIIRCYRIKGLKRKKD